MPLMMAGSISCRIELDVQGCCKVSSRHIYTLTEEEDASSSLNNHKQKSLGSL